MGGSQLKIPLTPSSEREEAAEVSPIPVEEVQVVDDCGMGEGFSVPQVAEIATNAVATAVGRTAQRRSNASCWPELGFFVSAYKGYSPDGPCKVGDPLGRS